MADEFDVSLGTAGVISTTQLAGFVVASWAAGRRLQPRRSVFIAIGVIGLLANLAAALAPTLGVLAATRAASGVALGLAAWFAWQDAFGNADKTGDVAVVGPVIGLVLAPALTYLLSEFGTSTVFVVLAGVAAAPVAFAGQIIDVETDAARPERNRATRAATIILVALGLVTLAGSSVFVFAAAIGTEFNDLSPLTVSLLFSANALAAIPAAKWPGARGPAGMWFGIIAVNALVLPSVHLAPVFALAMVTWGFVFFMAVPAAFTLLASRSKYPAERAGDAQAVMALGRVFGPILGGVFIADGRTALMGIVAAAIMACAAIVLFAVERHGAAPT